MPRKPRIDFPGAWHHVMHRAARRKAIFRADADCVLLLDLLGETVRRFAVWALSRATPLTQAEIGALLGMSAAHVARDLFRTRANIAAFDA